MNSILEIQTNLHWNKKGSMCCKINVGPSELRRISLENEFEYEMLEHVTIESYR